MLTSYASISTNRNQNNQLKSGEKLKTNRSGMDSSHRQAPTERPHTKKEFKDDSDL